MIYEYLGYQIKPHKEYPSSYIVVTAGKGGKIPDVLSGMYTSTGIAKTAVDKYLASKPKKDIDNAEAVNQS